MYARTLLAMVMAAGLAGTGMFVGCGKHPDPWEHAKAGQKRVLAVTPALYCFTSNVAGDKAAVQCLLSDRGPHDYEPNAGDAIKARKADLFLANGLELDNFVAKVAITSGNKNLQIYKVAEELDHIDLLHPAHDHAEGHDHHGHDHGDHDPHVWLSPDRAKKISQIIADKLSALDPANKKEYQNNAATYGKELDALAEEGKAAFKEKKAAKNNKIVTMHDSMGYFADAFGIDVVATIHPKPGLEAELSRIKDIAKICRENKVAVICVEPQFSRGSAETLQKNLQTQGVEVKIVEFDPLETVAVGDTLDRGYYVRRMRQNIKNLSEALP